MTREEFEKLAEQVVDALDNLMNEAVPLCNYGSADDPEMDHFCQVCGSMGGPEEHEKDCPVREFHRAYQEIMVTNEVPSDAGQDAREKEDG